MRNLFPRRKFLAASLGTLIGTLPGITQPRRRPRVAAFYTVFRFRSHAFNILENFLRPFYFNGQITQPPCDVVSFYADQRVPSGDLTEDVARQFKIPVYQSIPDALTLGGKDLRVDAVLSIGEHGEYPINTLGQKEYPRKRFFDEAVAVMRRTHRFVPIFNDKHLSYRWDWAREMYDTARKLGIPFMAGSSVPLAQRRPTLDFPLNPAVEEAVSIHGGGIESYDFHGLEVLQSIVEFRKGGETGVSRVEFLSGDSLMEAGRQKRWSIRLAEAAMRAEMGKNFSTLEKATGRTEPHGILLTYRDGMRATVLKIGASSTRWNFAWKAPAGENIQATNFYVGPWGNRNLFMALSHAIQNHFVHRRAPYPVERTLLTTGITEAAVRSRADKLPRQTPHLNLSYTPQDFRPFREMGESWRIMEKTPEPKGLNPTGRK